MAPLKKTTLLSSIGAGRLRPPSTSTAAPNAHGHGASHGPRARPRKRAEQARDRHKHDATEPHEVHMATMHHATALRPERPALLDRHPDAPLSAPAQPRPARRPSSPDEALSRRSSSIAAAPQLLELDRLADDAEDLQDAQHQLRPSVGLRAKPGAGPGSRLAASRCQGVCGHNAPGDGLVWVQGNLGLGMSRRRCASV